MYEQVRNLLRRPPQDRQEIDIGRACAGTAHIQGGDHCSIEAGDGDGDRAHSHFHFLVVHGEPDLSGSPDDRA
jgi:hypothetical protein